MTSAEVVLQCQLNLYVKAPPSLFAQSMAQLTQTRVPDKNVFVCLSCLTFATEPCLVREPSAYRLLNLGLDLLSFFITQLLQTS